MPPRAMLMLRDAAAAAMRYMLDADDADTIRRMPPPYAAFDADALFCRHLIAFATP